jgi:hypothetical protein
VSLTDDSMVISYSPGALFLVMCDPSMNEL